MKLLFRYIYLLFVFLIASCSLQKVSFTVDKKNAYLGETVELNWKVKKSAKAFNIEIVGEKNKKEFNTLFYSEDLDSLLKNPSARKKKEFVLLADSLARKGSIRASIDSIEKFHIVVYVSDGTPIIRYQTVKVLSPKIVNFSAVRDYENNELVHLTWDTKEIKELELEGIKTKLPKKGSMNYKTKFEQEFVLIGNNKHYEVNEVRTVGNIEKQQRAMVKDVKNIDNIESNSLTFEIIETNVKNYPKEVELKVLVVDGAGNFISDLAPPFVPKDYSREYFKKVIETVKANSAELEFKVEEIRESNECYDMSLVLDYSNSMTNSITKLEQSVENFIRNKYAPDNFSIVKFDDSLHLACDLKNDINEILEAANFNGIDSFGGTAALYAAADVGLKSLQKGTNQKVVVLFTDGFENASFQYYGEYASSLNELVKHIKDMGASLYLISYGATYNDKLVSDLVSSTNGRFYQINQIQDLNAVYEDIRRLSRTYYKITYRPIMRNGSHNVQLTYFNEISNSVTDRNYLIADSLNFDKFNIDTNAYWFDSIMVKKGYKLKFSPQVLVNFEYDKHQVY